MSIFLAQWCVSTPVSKPFSAWWVAQDSHFDHLYQLRPSSFTAIQSHPVAFHAQGEIPSKAPIQSSDGLCHFFRRAVGRCAGASTLALKKWTENHPKTKEFKMSWKMSWIMNWMILLDIDHCSVQTHWNSAPSRDSESCDLSLVSGCFRSRCKLIPENLDKHRENPRGLQGPTVPLSKMAFSIQPIEGTDEAW